MSQNHDIMPRHEVGIIIPVYRATPALPALLQALEKDLAHTDWHAYIIDDSAHAPTQSFVRQHCTGPRVTCICLADNSGQQNAVLCGIRAALPHCCKFVTMDDDGQHPARLVPILLQKLSPQNSLVYAVPIEPDAGVRGMGSHARDVLFRLCFSLPKDITVSSFRAFTHDVAEHVAAFSGSFFYFSAVALGTKPVVQCISYNPHTRIYGKSGYTLKKLVLLYCGIIHYYLLCTKQPPRVLYKIESIWEGDEST